MPTYRYECLVAGGGCGQTWPDQKAVHARQQVMCPNCSQDGMETFYDQEAHLTRNKVMIVIQLPGYIPDIDHQEGRTGARIPMPAFGPKATVGSRRELKEMMLRAREHIYNMTGGEHSAMVPVRREDGDIIFEKQTTVHKNFDPGEIVPMEKLPEILNDPVDPETGKTYRAIELELRRRLGDVDAETEDEIIATRIATEDPPVPLGPPTPAVKLSKHGKPLGRPKGSKNKQLVPRAKR